MDQKRTKNGQKWVFFKYSRIIYRWKAYGEVITTSLISFEIFHFQAQMDQNEPIKDQNGSKIVFFKYSRVIYEI